MLNNINSLHDINSQFNDGTLVAHRRMLIHHTVVRCSAYIMTMSSESVYQDRVSISLCANITDEQRHMATHN